MDASSSLIYSLLGHDSSQFNLNSDTGELSFAQVSDYENPNDDNQNNVYEVVVQVSDGDLNATQAFYISVFNLNEAPIIQSNGALESVEITVLENIEGNFTRIHVTHPEGYPPDGRIDILSASSSDDRIAWYENNGNRSFGSMQTITTSADGANSVYAADLDGDGDNDVLGFFGGRSDCVVRE